MRKTAIALLALCLATSFWVAPTSAVNLVTEAFNYPDGNLVPNGGWATYSGTNVDVKVASGRATGGAIGNPQNDDHKLFTAQPLTSKTYACFDVLIPAFTGAPKPIYFLELKDAGAALLVSRVYVLPLAAGGWTFGISYSSTSATVGVTPWTTALSFDTVYIIVISYDPVNFTATLWVNPINESSPSVSNVGTAAAIAVSGVGLRQSNSASTLPPVPPYVGTADWNWSVDNLGVGTSFDDACRGTVTVTPSTWSNVKRLYH